MVGVIAACLGIYGLIEIRKQDAKNNSETESGDA